MQQQRTCMQRTIEDVNNNKNMTSEAKIRVRRHNYMHTKYTAMIDDTREGLVVVVYCTESECEERAVYQRKWTEVLVRSHKLRLPNRVLEVKPYTREMRIVI